MKKVISVLLVATLLALLLSGCSGGDNQFVKGTIKIGGCGPLTGEASTYGTSVKQGALLAIDEINAAGGVNGVKLSMRFEDDEAIGDKAKSAYETLMDKGMQIFMGAVTSAASVAVNDLVKKDGILQVTPSASQIEAAENPNSFRICYIDPVQGETMAQYAFDTLKYSKAAIIYNQDDSYSKGIYTAFKEKWAALGGTVSADTSFGKDATDYSAQLTKILNSDAEFLFMPIYAEKASAIVIEASQKGLKLPMLGCDGLDGILNYLKGDNVKLVEGMIYLTPFVASDTSEKTQKFVKDYKAKYGEEPDQFAADAYDAIYVIKAALEKAGVNSTEIDNAKLVAAMTQITVDGLTGSMTFDEAGEPHKSIKLAKIVDGKYMVLEGSSAA